MIYKSDQVKAPIIVTVEADLNVKHLPAVPPTFLTLRLKYLKSFQVRAKVMSKISRVAWVSSSNLSGLLVL